MLTLCLWPAINSFVVVRRAYLATVSKNRLYCLGVGYSFGQLGCQFEMVLGQHCLPECCQSSKTFYSQVCFSSVCAGAYACVRACQTQPVWVPYFFSQGNYAMQDSTVLTQFS